MHCNIISLPVGFNCGTVLPDNGTVRVYRNMLQWHFNNTELAQCNGPSPLSWRIQPKSPRQSHAILNICKVLARPSILIFHQNRECVYHLFKAILATLRLTLTDFVSYGQTALQPSPASSIILSRSAASPFKFDEAILDGEGQLMPG